LEESARRGNAEAARTLAHAPECPEPLAYLLGWFEDVFGRSGVGMSGLAPLTWSTLADWSAMTGTVIDAREARALLHLDAVQRNPEIAAIEDREPAPMAPWPTKKRESADG